MYLSKAGKYPVPGIGGYPLPGIGGYPLPGIEGYPLPGIKGGFPPGTQKPIHSFTDKLPFSSLRTGYELNDK